MEHKKTDLRVIRTKKSIRDAFYAMILEMDYQDITIKELTNRAMINRNTFYLHYETIDALFDELVDELSQLFIQQDISYRNIGDIKRLMKIFFETPNRNPVHERILVCDSYRFIYERVNKKIMDHRKKTQRGAFDIDVTRESLVFTYYGEIVGILYRQWVQDGKKLPLEDALDLATKLVCNGMESVIK